MLYNYKLIKSLKLCGVEFDWHHEQGHKKCRVHELFRSKLARKWLNMKVLVFKCFLMVAIWRLQLKTGKAFQRKGIPLKYEFWVELFEETECFTWLLILKLAVGLFKDLMKNIVSEISYWHISGKRLSLIKCCRQSLLKSFRIYFVACRWACLRLLISVIR